MNTPQAPQIAFAKKAAAIKAGGKSNKLIETDANAPPLRLLKKSEVLRIAGVTYPTLWKWMCSGRFPRARNVGGRSNSRSVWRSDEVEQWLAKLPVRRLKGDLA